MAKNKNLSALFVKTERGHGSPWLRWWLPSVRSPWSIIEIVVGVAVAVGLGFWASPDDPLLLRLGFPWMSVLVWVFALRYGVLLGAVAGGCLWVVWRLAYGAEALFPLHYFVGTFSVAIICGHFSDLWAGRLAHEGSVNRYLGSRLVSLTNGYYLLRVSHDRIERELLSRPTTLRESIAHLRALIGQGTGSDPLPQAQAFLDYLASVSQLNEAAIFVAHDATLSDDPCAYVGERFTLDMQDPLLRRCIETGDLVHVRDIADSPTSTVACVPLRVDSGEILGVLIIRRLHFLSLNQDSLQFLLVVLAYYADSIRQQPAIERIRRQVPGCPEDFALELSRMAHLSRHSDMSSYLVAMSFRKGGVEQAVGAQMMRQRRALDVAWMVDREDRQIMVVLLVLTDESGVDGYVTRLEQIMKAQFGLDFTQAQVGVYHQEVKAVDPADGLRRFMELW